MDRIVSNKNVYADQVLYYIGLHIHLFIYSTHIFKYSIPFLGLFVIRGRLPRPRIQVNPFHQNQHEFLILSMYPVVLGTSCIWGLSSYRRSKRSPSPHIEDHEWSSLSEAPMPQPLGDCFFKIVFSFLIYLTDWYSNGHDAVRQWSDEFAVRMRDVLAANFLAYDVVLFSDRNESMMSCFACQVEVFSQTDVLVGMHGAGLGHQIYMPYKYLHMLIYGTKE